MGRPNLVGVRVTLSLSVSSGAIERTHQILTGPLCAIDIPDVLTQIYLSVARLLETGSHSSWFQIAFGNGAHDPIANLELLIPL